MMRFTRVVSLSCLATISLIFTGCEGFDDYDESPSESIGQMGVAGVPSGNPSYVLRPMDVINFEVHTQLDTRGRYTISATGDLVGLPYVGNVHVGGLSLDQARAKIAARYSEYYKNPQITLTIEKYAERIVYVEGFVARSTPVAFLPERELTLVQAITFAGGVLPRGDRKAVRVTRERADGSKVVEIVDLVAISKGEKPDFVLQENDIVYVPDSVF